ncbi:DAGKc domain-containing protein OS=Streptomyces microflavus OX=1919 GN=Smic_79790 PE=4 SV=1 [Streptomyces microflavus]
MLLSGKSRGGGGRRAAGTSRSTTAVGGPVEFHTFRRAELSFTRPQPREVDGDPVGPGRRLTAEVRPGALTVMLPARER